MNERRTPTPNTKWIVVMADGVDVDGVYDELEAVGCEVLRNIAPVSVNQGRLAIGVMGPANLDVAISESCPTLKDWLISLSPQVPPGGDPLGMVLGER